MRFDAKTAARIARGDKTEHRRPFTRRSPYRSVDQFISFLRPRRPEDGPPKYGDDVTVVQSICRVVIVGQAPAKLGDMTETDARAEGFRSNGRITALAQYRTWWEETHGPWSDETTVRVVRFELEQEWEPSYMADTRAGHGDYTASPIRAIDELPVAPSVPSLHTDQRRKRETFDRQMLSTEERMRRARAEARRYGVDVTRQEARLMDALRANDRSRVTAGIESMERKVRGKAA